jgi:hypothetical protein
VGNWDTGAKAHFLNGWVGFLNCHFLEFSENGWLAAGTCIERHL